MYFFLINVYKGLNHGRGMAKPCSAGQLSATELRMTSVSSSNAKFVRHVTFVRFSEAEC